MPGVPVVSSRVLLMTGMFLMDSMVRDAAMTLVPGMAFMSSVMMLAHSLTGAGSRFNARSFHSE